jgi:hypothetical protein
VPFHTDQTWICRILAAEGLGVIPTAVGVHEASEPVIIGRLAGKARIPALPWARPAPSCRQHEGELPASARRGMCGHLLSEGAIHK